MHNNGYDRWDGGHSNVSIHMNVQIPGAFYLYDPFYGFDLLGPFHRQRRSPPVATRLEAGGKNRLSAAE